MKVGSMPSVFKLLLLAVILTVGQCRYQPNWDSVDSRPLPAWYDQSKIGIFIHWGVFSVPSFSSEWFWSQWNLRNQDVVDFMNKNYRPGFTYQDFATQFTAEFYNPDQWADIFAASGAKYVVLTSKHHEGYTLWPSSVSWNWNSMDVGPKRNLLGDLAKSIRNRTDIHFGVYHSLFEWFNPLYIRDKANNWKTRDFVTTKTIPELIELVETYKPEVIWSDGDWEPKDTYWNSTGFLSWLYNDSPVKDVVVVNDRWGSNTACHHGGYYTCSDKYNPGVLQKHKWENAMTLDLGSWGYRRNAQLSSYMSFSQLLVQLASTISCGGNLLINIGPTADGRIEPIFEERLRQMGAWLKVNGEAIYESKPWTYQNDTLTPNVWYTSKSDNVYSIILVWPKNSVITLASLSPEDGTIITMLGVEGNLHWTFDSQGRTIVSLPLLTPGIFPGEWAWVLKIQPPSLNQALNSNEIEVDNYIRFKP